MKKRMLIILLLVFSLGQTKIQSQTVLINPTGDGEFETGATFAANGWTAVNAASNLWEVGTVATQYAGSRGVYVANPAGTYAYSNATARTSHFYKDVVIPAGATNITLSFYWKGKGESGYDRTLIYTAPTTVTPVANTPSSSTTNFTGATLIWTQPTFTTTTYGLATVTIPDALAGTTVRLIFTWQNDGSLGTTQGTAIDNISLTCVIPTPCSGAPTGGTTNATVTSGCSGYTSSLSVTGSSVNTGLTYQWESSPTGGAPWTVIGGATSATYTPSITSALYFRRQTLCTSSGFSDYSSSILLSIAENDNCVNAIPINPDTNCSGFSIVCGTIGCATNSGVTAPIGIADDDVWFSFVAEATTVKTTIGNTSGSDLVTQFFTGSCGSLVSAGYYDTDPNNTRWNGLTIGTTYYIRVYSYGSTAITGTAAQFTLCVKNIVPPPTPPVQAPCTNLGFESGFTGWYGTEGNSVDGSTTASTPLYIPDVYNETSGTNFAIVTAGTDPIAPINTVYSGTQSLKLGNEATYETYNGASIEQTFTVTAANTDFVYNYAVVLEDGAHPDYEQPFFQAQFFDGSGNEVTCGSFQATAPGTGASFIQIGTTDYYYKPWTTGSVNLTAFIGQNMTVRFTISDCSIGAHPGYAYIDCSCAEYGTIEPKTICLGQSATLTAPSGASSYSWTPGGATTQSITVSPTTTTTYTCNITPSGISPCNFSLSADVTIFSSEMAIASSNSPICNGSVLNLTSAPNGGTSYSWSGPNGFASSDQNPSISVANATAAGIYTVTVSLAGGCSGTASTTVVINTLPVPIIQNNTGSTMLTCTTNPINVTAIGGNTYTWDDESATATNSFTTPGTYTVTATSASGCSSTTSISITRDASFPIAHIENNTQTTELTCTTPIIYVTANGGVTYTWSGGTSTTTSENNFISPGTYTVTVTGTETCTATSSITITQNTTPPTPIAFNNGPICSGEDLTLTGNGGSTYAWSGPDGFSSNLSNPSVMDATPASAGTYSVTATGLNGCTATAQTTVVINPLPLAGFTYSSTGPTITFTNTSTNATSYFWNFGGSNSTTANPVYTFPADGQYNISLIAINGNCSDTTSQLVTVTGVGIATNEINSINIYPNPTSGIFTLKLDAEANNALMTIVDVTGRVVFQKTVNGSEATINLPHFAPGVYAVKLDLGKRILHQRLVVK